MEAVETVVATAGDGRDRRTAFVFAGGAALGSIQTGMLRALFKTGIQPDIVTGTSSGAVNGAMVAADPSPTSVERLTALWRAARRSDVVQVRPAGVLRAITGRSAHLVEPTGLRRLVEEHIPIKRLEDARLPLAVVAADLSTRKKVVLTSGPTADALSASTAIPGLYPPVVIAGRALVDGGLVEDPPLATAVQAGATRAYVLPVGWPLVDAAPNGWRARALDALDWLFWRLALAELDRWSSVCEVFVLPSPNTRTLSPFDPGSADALIELAERMATGWLADPRPWPAAPPISSRGSRPGGPDAG